MIFPPWFHLKFLAKKNNQGGFGFFLPFSEHPLGPASSWRDPALLGPHQGGDPPFSSRHFFPACSGSPWGPSENCYSVFCPPPPANQDPKNGALRHSVLCAHTTARQLVSMKPDELANPALKEEYRKIAEYKVPANLPTPSLPALSGLGPCGVQMGGCPLQWVRSRRLGAGYSVR